VCPITTLAADASTICTWSYTTRLMGRFSDRELVRTHADNSLEMFDWLESHGVKWDQRRRAARASCGPSPKPRARWGWKSCAASSPYGAGAKPLHVDESDAAVLRSIAASFAWLRSPQAVTPP
jgi:succinate dehydrogenase/fumarate reductase flavoprotein subunit